MDGNTAVAVATEPDDRAPAGVTVHARPRPPVGRWLLEALGPVALVVATLRLHDMATALRLPYWLDEAWVAASTRYGFGDLLSVTSSTPVGWTFLLHLVPSTDKLRLLPIAFLVVSVVAGYALASAVRWPTTAHRVIAGLATGGAVALLPAQQLRHDLKQYTADAAFALILLAVTALVETTYSRGRLALLVATATVAVLVSHTATLVGACAVGGLFLAAAVRREWRRAAAAALAGLAMLAVFVVSYLVLARGGDNSSMEDFWVDYFPRIDQLGPYLAGRFSALQPYLGVTWQWLLILALAGVVTIGRLGRPALAWACGLVPLAAVVAGVARQYPLLDLRTSHYLLVVLVALAAIGAVGTVTWLAGLATRRSRAAGAVIAGVVLAAILGGYVWATADWIRFDGRSATLRVRIAATSEDVRRPTRFVYSHRKPGDVVMVTGSGAYGFAVYWRDRPGYHKDPNFAVGWQPTYTDDRIILLSGRDQASIHAGIQRATALAAQAGPEAVVWVVRSHMVADERAAWDAELAGLTVEGTPSGPEAALRIVAW